MHLELQSLEREKSYELRDLKRETEERIRHLEYENKRLKKENQSLNAELDAQDSYISHARNNSEVNRVYEDFERQTERLEARLKDSERKYHELKTEFDEVVEANVYLKNVIDEKEEIIHSLETQEPRIEYRERDYKPKDPVKPASISYRPTENPSVIEGLRKQLKDSEAENERLREQAYKADKEVDRLKDNIVLREREIHNIKKSIPVGNAHRDHSAPKDQSIPKDKSGDFVLSMESNPNLVSEMAKITGSSGFKYGQKGPYDESLEKLRKEFSLQQKELGLDTLSEVSIGKFTILKS